MLPPLPSWDGLHPLIIHFPIALLIIAPVIVLLGILWPGKGRAILVSAFVLMLIGTFFAFVAVATGEAAGELAERTAAGGVLEEHSELAETTRTVFSVLTVVFGAMVFAPMLIRRELAQKVLIPLHLAFLLFYGSGLVLLANTAHQGGRLVHEFGVRAMMGTSSQTYEAPKKTKGKDDDD